MGALALMLVNLGPTVAQAAPPGPQPYQLYGAGSCSVGSCTLTLTGIPSGKRLVIQHVSVSAVGNTGVQPYVWLSVSLANTQAFYFLEVTKYASALGQDYFRGNLQLLAFADNTGPSHVTGGAVSGSMTGMSAAVSGYLEPL